MVALPSNKVVVLVSAYNQWRNRHRTHQVAVLLPKIWFAGAGRNGQIAKLDPEIQASMTSSEADLSAANLLSTDYQNNPDIIAHVAFMAGARGDTYVMSNLGRYEGLIQELSNTLRPLTAADGS